MKKLFTEDGIEITDELIEQWAKPWEQGKIPGTPGEIVVGRPRISAEELTTVTFKLPESKLKALDAAAKRAGETRSQFLRSTIDKVLAHA